MNLRVLVLPALVWGLVPAHAQEKVVIEPYGYIKMDSAYDSRASTAGDFMKWVNPAPNGQPQFNMTGNQTRLGAKLSGIHSSRFEVSGQVESDLYSLQGGAGQENKPGILFRHFFLQAKLLNTGLSFLAGQTSDVIAPLTPDTVNYSVLWWSGNIGYRRPQLRLIDTIKLGQATVLKAEVAAVRVLGHDGEASYTGTPTPANPSATANDSRSPGVQARVSVALPLWLATPAEFGIGTYQATESYQTNHSLRQVAYALDVMLPLTEKMSLKGEWYGGENVDTLNGGIGQGVNSADNRSVGARGGWLQLSYVANPLTKLNLGYGRDSVSEGDLTAASVRTSNTSVYVNIFHSLTKNLQVAYETSRWKTTYKGTSDTGNVNYRQQLAFIYGF